MHAMMREGCSIVIDRTVIARRDESITRRRHKKTGAKLLHRFFRAA
jgi:hypothetical protein